MRVQNVKHKLGQEPTQPKTLLRKKQLESLQGIDTLLQAVCPSAQASFTLPVGVTSARSTLCSLTILRTAGVMMSFESLWPVGVFEAVSVGAAAAGASVALALA